MKKNLIIGILCGIVIALGVAFIISTGVGPCGPDGPDGTNGPVQGGIGGTNVHVVRRPLEPEATKRLHNGPVIVSSTFEASGKAEHASYGKSVSGSYLYTTTIRARSEIIKKEENADTGEIRVVERRTFLQARDSISLSELDIAVSLDTLPIDQVKTWCNGICDLVDGVSRMLYPAANPINKGVKIAINATFASLYAIDRLSARVLLAAFNVEIPENIEDFANKHIADLVKDKLRPVDMAFHTIEGKSFIITYTQQGNGEPLQVDFQNANGAPITETEWEILRQANAFLDSSMVPDTRCKVGDYWNVWADEVQDLFGAAGEGRAEGKIRVTREDDKPNGDWTLRLDRTYVTFRTNSGLTSGKLEIKDGNGLVDSKSKSVKSLQATAIGNLSAMNKKRHALFFDFVKRIQGDSNLRFILTTEPAGKNE